MSKKVAVQDSEHAEYEADVVAGMVEAYEIAEQLFGMQVNARAVQDIYDYMNGADEDEFIADLTRTVEHTKRIYKTTAPTPEQVFGLFDRIFEEDDKN